MKCRKDVQEIVNLMNIMNKAETQPHAQYYDSGWKCRWEPEAAGLRTGRRASAGPRPKGAFRLGLRFVKGLRRDAGRMIETEQARGRFESSQDLTRRLLYYIYTADGASIDAALVREGLARAWTRDGQHRRTLDQIGSGVGCLW